MTSTSGTSATPAPAPAARTVLHVGCGVQKPGRLHAMFRAPGWQELRLDLNPDARPDFVASLTDMGVVDSASVDAVYSSHNLEHLFPHEVPVALAEFRRVLKDDGLALVTLPDVQTAAEIIAAGQATRTLYTSPLGPVTALDILYGHHRSLASGNLLMLHKCGFTDALLHRALTVAGFGSVRVRRDRAGYSLWALAHVQPGQTREIPGFAVTPASGSGGAPAPGGPFG